MATPFPRKASPTFGRARYSPPERRIPDTLSEMPAQRFSNKKDACIFFVNM